jgi:hypothetical protein
MKSTPLSGTDYPVTETSYAQAFWPLRRYSSFTYIAQMYRLMASFVRAYEKHSVSKRESAIWMRDVFGRLYLWQGNIEKGLSRLRQGDRSGLSEIWSGSKFADYLMSQRFEYGRDFEDIGFDQYQPATGLWAWGERAIVMAGRIDKTIRAHWSFESLLDQFVPEIFPATLPAFPSPSGPTLSPGEDSPFSAVWLPIDVPRACPNYRVRGHVDIGVRIPNKRTDIPARPAEYGVPERPAERHYEFSAVPTRWQLVWEDHRCTSGELPQEEAEYLDETTKFPNDAAMPIAPFPFRTGA